MTTNIIKHSRNLLISEGIFLIIIGLFIIYMSQAATLFFSLLLSIGLFFIGIYRTINAIVTRKDIATPFIAIMSGLLLSIIGLYLILNPLFNSMVLTIGIALFLIVESVNSFSTAVSVKGFKQLFWIALSTGIVQLLLAIIIIWGLPYTALWLLGMIIGINFVFSGISCISGYIYSKDLA